MPLVAASLSCAVLKRPILRGLAVVDKTNAPGHARGFRRSARRGASEAASTGIKRHRKLRGRAAWHSHYHP